MNKETLDQKVERWLDSKVNDRYVESIDEETPGFPPRYYYRNRTMEEFFYYYTGLDDTDIKASERFMSWLEPTPYLNSLLEIYKKEEDEMDDEWKSANKEKESQKNRFKHLPDQIIILIPPHTNRYHANYLFKQLIDYGIKNNLFYGVTNLKTGERSTVPLIHPKFKRDFYRFCYLNTKKTTHW